MPVRLLSSPVLKWPDAQAVDEAARLWANRLAETTKDVLAVGYFGSYGRGDWGVGSDLDMIILVRGSSRVFERRAEAFDTTPLPVPVDLMVFTSAEWESQRTFVRRIQPEMKWVYRRSD